MKHNNLIIFATYWNEIDWIEPSLKQIEKLNPKEVIICDGCFDPSKINKSTDGTHEIIKKWVSKRDNAQMISAIRTSKTKAIFKILKSHSKIKWYYILTPSRLKALYLTLINNIYRVNQALTFQHMISISKKWGKNDWFMSYDCDQFYYDDTIKKIIKIVNNKNIDKNIGLLTGNENTFFKNFNEYTNEYEKRNYNNMPHRIYNSTNIMPTRAIILDQISFKTFNIQKLFKSDFYFNKKNSIFVGEYNHYKFKFDKTRFNDGYKLGNRKKPIIKSYTIKKFKKNHPEIILKLIKNKNKKK